MILTLTHSAHGGVFDLPTASLLYWSPLPNGSTQLRLRDGSTMDVKEAPPVVRRMYEGALGQLAQAQAAPIALFATTAADSRAALPGPVDGDPTAPRVLSIAGPPNELGEMGWDDEESREHAAALFGREGEYHAELLAMVRPLLATHPVGAAVPCAMLAAGVEAGHGATVSGWDASGMILAMGVALVLALEGYVVEYQQGAGPILHKRPR